MDNESDDIEARKAKVCRLYAEGMSLRGVARTIPESHETVRTWLIEQGIPVRVRGKKPIALQQTAANMYAAGVSSEAVAIRLNVAKSSVLDWCRKFGVPIRKPGRLNYGDATKAKAVGLYRVHRSSIRVSELMGGIPPTTILRWGQAEGIWVRRGRPRKRLTNEQRTGQP